MTENYNISPVNKSTLSKFYRFFYSEIKDIPDVLNKSYFPSLDGLRGIAIIVVICSHLTLDTQFAKYFDGKMGVEIFFVLSGFLITTLLIKEKIKKGDVSFRKFYIRRILRIVPVVYLFLIVLFFLNYFFELNISLKSFGISFLYLGNLPINVAGEKWYTAHFWTLAIEEQFYLFFPWLLIYNLNHYVKLICLFVVLAPLAQFLLYNKVGIFYSNHLIHNITIVFVLLFSGGTIPILLGSLFSILIFKNILSIKKTINSYYVSFFMFAITIVLRTYLGSTADNVSIYSILFSFVIGYLIALSLNSKDILNGILKNNVLIKIGLLSYSLYVWQQLFTSHQPWRNSFLFSNSLFFNIPALFIVSYLSYNFYEKRFLKYKEEFK